MEITGDTFESPALAQLLVESMDAYALFVVDESSTIVSWNPGVRSLLLYDRSEFLGRDARMLFRQGDIDAARRERESALEGTRNVGRWLRRKDTSLVWCDGTVSALRDGDRLVGFAYALRDGSDGRRREDELDDATRQKDRFLSTVSHELRTPLMAILGWIRVLQDGELNDVEVRSALSTIERNAMMQRKLIEDLLDCARLVAGSLEITRSETDIEQLVTSEVESLRALAAEKEIQLTARTPGQIVLACIDSDRMRQVLANLLLNAIKFTLDGGSIDVELTQRASDVRISVTDTGVGIEPERLPRLFERFQSVAGVSAFAESGVGLGLCIVREIVELHGGTVTATSDGLGRGATFTITIPTST